MELSETDTPNSALQHALLPLGQFGVLEEHARSHAASYLQDLVEYE
jgi:hypothetical protein